MTTSPLSAQTDFHWSLSASTVCQRSQGNGKLSWVCLHTDSLGYRLSSSALFTFLLRLLEMAITFILHSVNSEIDQRMIFCGLMCRCIVKTMQSNLKSSKASSVMQRSPNGSQGLTESGIAGQQNRTILFLLQASYQQRSTLQWIPHYPLHSAIFMKNPFQSLWRTPDAMVANLNI